MEHEHGSCGGVILAHSTNRTSGPNENLIYVIFCMRQFVCLMFFSPHSPAVSVRTQAAHWLPLALLGGEKNNAEENRHITKK